MCKRIRLGTVTYTIANGYLPEMGFTNIETNFMKHFPFYLSLLATCFGAAGNLKADDWGELTNNFKMSIRLETIKAEIQTNQPCVLLIRYKNVSTNETFWVYENGTEYDPAYSFTVISPSGKDISPDMNRFKPCDATAVRHVGPNQILQIKFNLSLLCKFNEEGNYKVIAKYKEAFAFEKRKTFTVVSNPLSVLVVFRK